MTNRGNFDYPEKPTDWPVNNVECTIENILNAVEKFEKNPNSETKEILISLTSNYDLNQFSHTGLVRITNYEIGAINSLWCASYIFNIPSIKHILYDIIETNARFRKIEINFNPKIGLFIEPYKKLLPSLNLFYIIYLQFNLYKNKSFCETIIEVTEFCIEKDFSRENIDTITHAFTQMLRDFSDFHSKTIRGIFAFSKDELYKLYSLQAKLLKLNKDSLKSRDLRGTLMISISNYLLKSRNNYNENYICKYISPENVLKSFSNRQIWIREVKSLNDDREQKIISELFEDNSWLNFDWGKEIDLLSKRQYYVSSFCKNFKNDEMKKKYGSCIYGYKNDRIVELIAPIIKSRFGNKMYPMLSQVVVFDVLYDKEEIKTEINFLCKIIDLFGITIIEKKNFLQEIMQYWILSIKDSKWSYEQERRYVIFQYPDYEYRDSIFEDGFLKIETSLFHYPDFILGENPIHSDLTFLSNQKRNAFYIKEYMHCNNCLSNDFDIVWQNPKVCPICGSSEYTKTLKFVK